MVLQERESEFVLSKVVVRRGSKSPEHSVLWIESGENIGPLIQISTQINWGESRRVWENVLVVGEGQRVSLSKIGQREVPTLNTNQRKQKRSNKDLPKICIYFLSPSAPNGEDPGVTLPTFSGLARRV